MLTFALLAAAYHLFGLCVSLVAAVAKDVSPDSKFSRGVNALAHALPGNLPAAVGELLPKEEQK